MLDVNNLLGFQSKTNQKSELRLYNISALASANSRIFVFATQLKSIGNAITWNRDAVNGDYFRINEDGLYDITLSNRRSGGAANIFGISVNWPWDSLGTDVSTSTPPGYGIPLDVCRVSVSASDGGNGPSHAVSWLRAGDIIRCHGDGNSFSSDVYGRLAIVQLVRG